MKLKRYKEFINENINQAKSIIQKKIDDYEKLKILLSKNIGYIGKFTEYLINKNVPYTELEKLYSDLLTLKSKNISIDINPLNYEQVLDKIQQSSNNLSINYLINKFTSEMKNISREALKDVNNYRSEEFKNLLLVVSKKQNLEAFISKISRYKTFNELYNALKIFSKDPINEKEKVIELINTLKSDIVYKNEEIMVILVNNYDDITKLGSDTSWCITKSESIFNSYAKGRYQFILYDYTLDEYNPYFKIGFTLNLDLSIHAAHNILDHKCISHLIDVLKRYNISFKNFIPKRESLNFDLSKINSKTTFEFLNKISLECDINKLKIVIKKLVTLKKTPDGIRKLLKICYSRLFSDKEFVTKFDLDEISKELYPKLYNDNINNLITDKLNTKLIETAFIKSLEILPNEGFIDMDFYDLKKIEENYSDETLKLLSNRLNEMYRNNKIPKNLFPNYHDKEHNGIKYSKNYEGVMLVCNAILKRIKETPDYDILIKTPNEEITKRYGEEIKLPIDINLDRNFTLKDIENNQIIKKDSRTYYTRIFYNEKSPKETMIKYIKLINYLKDKNLIILFSKKQLSEIINHINWYEDDQTKIITSMLRELNKKYKKSGSSLTNGNLTIKIY